jgi:multidrug resistance efflux pump
VDEQYRPIETPLPQRMADFKRRYLPMIVWSGAALTCVWLMTGRANRFEYIGLARSVQYEVSANAVGRLETLLVDLYDRVEAGDLVAKLDDSEIGARIERSRATIRQLGAELDASRMQLVADDRIDRASWHNDLRRFETDEEDRRLAALELRVTIESDEIELERLALEQQRAGPLLETGLIGQEEYDNIRLLHDTVQTRVEENRVLLAQTESEYRTAVLRREAFSKSLPSIPQEEPLLRPLREAIEAENGRLREIQSRREATVLRSPVTGQVSSILCRQGQTVVPGEPILTIADGTVTEILAYLGETDSERAQQNTPVLVASMSRPGKVAESFVVRLGPDVEMLPQRLWREPTTPEYGRAVVIAAVPGLDLTPGELLSVKLVNRR